MHNRTRGRISVSGTSSGGGISSISPAACIALGQLSLLALSLLQVAAMCFACRTYQRTRTTWQLALRWTRAAVQVATVVLTTAAPQHWTGHFGAEGMDPRRALASALGSIPACYFLMAIVNPCPVAAQPLLALAAFATYVSGWLPPTRAQWERPELAGLTGVLCERMHDAVVLANSVTSAVFG